jgi:poly(3-hydroxyalkanoate) depolymerase
VSWGGVLAQEFAKQNGNRVRRLVLAATSPGQLMFPGKLSALRRMATPRRYISSSYMARAAPFIYGGLVRQKPEVIGRHASLIRRPSGRGYLYQLLAGYGFTSLPWLYQLHMPTLIMAGDDDPIMPVANARLLHFLIAKSRLHVVKGGGHLFLVTRAHESASVIERFLKTTHPAGRRVVN